MPIPIIKLETRNGEGLLRKERRACMMHLHYIVTGTGRSGTVGLADLFNHLGFPCSHERFFNGNSLEEALRLMETDGGENSYCSRHCGLPGHADRVVAESSYMAAPYLDASCFAGATIIHAVRNPWKVILSFLNHLQFFRGEPEHEHEKFVYSVLPQLHDIDNAVDRAIYYYIHWNRMIETLARKQRTELHGGLFNVYQRLIETITSERRSYYVFHRIEDGPERLLRKLGLSKERTRLCRKRANVNAFKEWPRELGAYAPIRHVTIEDINASKYSNELRKLGKQYGYRAPLSDEVQAKPVSDEAELRGNHEVRFAQVPRLVEEGYRGYNLVRWRDACYALAQGGAIDLKVATDDSLKDLEERGAIVVATRWSELKAKMDEVNSKRADMAGRTPTALVKSG